MQRCSRLVSSLSLLVLFAIGCGPPESAVQEAELVPVTINVKGPKGRGIELDSIAIHKPTGEGVTSELPSSGTISTRVVPGTYKVIAIPSSTNPNAAKALDPKYQDPAQTPWEINVTSGGQSFDLAVE